MNGLSREHKSFGSSDTGVTSPNANGDAGETMTGDTSRTLHDASKRSVGDDDNDLKGASNPPISLASPYQPSATSSSSVASSSQYLCITPTTSYHRRALARIDCSLRSRRNLSPSTASLSSTVPSLYVP